MAPNAIAATKRFYNEVFFALHGATDEVFTFFCVKTRNVVSVKTCLKISFSCLIRIIAEDSGEKTLANGHDSYSKTTSVLRSCAC